MTTYDQWKTRAPDERDADDPRWHVGEREWDEEAIPRPLIRSDNGWRWCDGCSTVVSAAVEHKCAEPRVFCECGSSFPVSTVRDRAHAECLCGRPVKLEEAPL
jgi:hypothetical protein